MQGQALEQQPDMPARENKPVAPGKAMTVGLLLALAAILLSTESATMVNAVGHKFFPYAMPQLPGMFYTGMTPLEHLVGLLRCFICLGGAAYAGRTASRLAPGAEILTGVTIFLGCFVAYGAATANQAFPMGLYAAWCGVLFPVFLSGGVWWGRQENRNGLVRLRPRGCARPGLALVCAIFAQWFVPILVLHAYAHLTTNTQDQIWFSDPAFVEARAAFGRLGIFTLESISAILGGYLCARLARQALIVVGPVLLIFLGFPVLKMSLDPYMGQFSRGEFQHLGFLFLGMLAGWVHVHMTKADNG